MQFVFLFGVGLVFSEGDVWREHRRFTIGCLRDFGMGKVVIEEKVLEEAAYLKEVIAGFEGKPFDPAEWVTKVSLHTAITRSLSVLPTLSSSAFVSLSMYQDIYVRALTQPSRMLYKCSTLVTAPPIIVCSPFGRD